MANHNRYDYYSSAELLTIWEELRDTLENAANPDEAGRILATLKLVEASKNWKR